MSTKTHMAFLLMAPNWKHPSIQPQQNGYMAAYINQWNSIQQNNNNNKWMQHIHERISKQKKPDTEKNVQYDSTKRYSRTGENYLW